MSCWGRYRPIPTDTTPLLAACYTIAYHDSGLFLEDGFTDPVQQGVAVKSTECAMQLVHLGANLTKTLNLSQLFRAHPFDGKTALELSRMTKRTELVELME
jgi:hypothetical protein